MDDLVESLNRAAELAALMEADPAAAADELDAWADKLRTLAEALRRHAEEGTRSSGGTSDRVMMRCVNPSGRTTQYTDTGE